MNSSESDIIPYQAAALPDVRNVLVFAPHPDDEVFGCGGALALHAQAGHTVQLVLLTAGDSKPGIGSDPDYARQRLVESRRAATVLGLAEPECWLLPDRSLSYGEALVQRIAQAIELYQAEAVYAPSLWEAHPDHRATAMAVLEAMRRLGGQRHLLQYELSALARPNRLLDVSAVWSLKVQAMACFASQNGGLDYPGFIDALNHYRAFTLPAAVQRVEAFEHYESSQLKLLALTQFESPRQRQLARGLPSTPQDLPLVSVLVRSTGRPSLQRALDSVLAQTYNHLDLVLVDAAGTGLGGYQPVADGLPLRLVGNGQPLGRSAAANLALQSARGEWLVFLDDDDWFYPDHLAKLTLAAAQHPNVRALHTGVECVDDDGRATGVVFDFAYAPRELCFGNFMPIHGVLFHRSMVEAGCRFDPTFDLYEDWDFWLQVEQQTAFAFVPGVSAAYRVNGVSGAGVQVDPDQSRLATARLHDKWGVLQSPSVFQELLSRVVLRRQLQGQIAGFHHVARQRDAEIARLTALANSQQARAAAAEAVADSTRQDAHHLRVAHDAACRDRDLALAARDQLQAHVEHLRSAHDAACRDRDRALGARDQALAQSAHAESQTLQAVATMGQAQLQAVQVQQVAAQSLADAAQARAEAVQAAAVAERARTEAAQAQTEAVRASAASERAQAEAQQARFETEQAQAEAQQARIEAQQAQSEAQQAQSEAQQAQSEAQQLRAAAEQTLAQAQAEIAQARQQAADLRAEAERAHALAFQYAQAGEQLRAELSAQQQRADALQASTSWRVTQPLRQAGALVRKTKTALAAYDAARSRGLSLNHLLRRTSQVYRREGIDGVRQRMATLLRVPGAAMPAAPINVQTDAVAAPAPALATTSSRRDYPHWVVQFDTLTEAQLQALRQTATALAQPPLVSIVMPVYNPAADDLRRAIASVQAQVYANWQLCICDDASTASHVGPLLKSLSGQDSRICVRRLTQNSHISAASNAAIDMALGEVVAFLDHDDELRPHALLRVVQTLLAQPTLKVLYSDEDKIDAGGRRFDPYFKPDFNLGLLRSHNYMCHFAVYQTAFLRELGGLRKGYEGAQDYDLVLRAVDAAPPGSVGHIASVLYHWRTAVGSTAAGHGEKSYAFDAGQRALAEHLKRRGLTGDVLGAPEAPGMYRVRWAIPVDAPLVSIIIPTRNGASILRLCLDSLRQTSYPNVEIIVVDNGSDEADALALLADRHASGQIRLLRDDRPFNFSAINNRAVREMARGEFVVLMNNDIEAMHSDWLAELVGPALEAGVGCVGARLWYPDGRLQHAGMVLVCGVAGHAHKYLPRGQHGYMGRAVLAQDMIGVTAACLLIRRSIYHEVGGLDEGLAVAFNDVDFCLRVHSAGYRNHWTPYAELVHHESLTRGHEDTPEKQQRFRSEIDTMQARWAALLAYDPCYNPNLTVDSEDISLAWPPRRELP